MSRLIASPKRTLIRTAVGLFVAGSVLLLSAARPETAAADPLIAVAGQTLDIVANKLDVDIDKGTALLEGGVSAKLGDLEIDCPKVEIRYDQAPQVRWARGSGGVTAKLQGIVANADRIELDMASRRVDLVGNVRLSRGTGWVQAESATIDIRTHKVSLEEVKGSIPVRTPAR